MPASPRSARTGISLDHRDEHPLARHPVVDVANHGLLPQVVLADRTRPGNGGPLGAHVTFAVVGMLRTPVAEQPVADGLRAVRPEDVQIDARRGESQAARRMPRGLAHGQVVAQLRRTARARRGRTAPPRCPPRAACRAPMGCDARIRGMVSDDLVGRRAVRPDRMSSSTTRIPLHGASRLPRLLHHEMLRRDVRAEGLRWRLGANDSTMRSPVRRGMPLTCRVGWSTIRTMERMCRRTGCRRDDIAAEAIARRRSISRRGDRRKLWGASVSCGEAVCSKRGLAVPVLVSR